MANNNPELPRGTYPGYWHFGVYGSVRVGWAHQPRRFLDFGPIRPLTKDRSEARTVAARIADKWGGNVGLFSVNKDRISRLVEIVKPGYKQKAKERAGAKKRAGAAAAGQASLFNGRPKKAAAKKAPAKKNTPKKRAGRRNPDVDVEAIEASEGFHGRPVEDVSTVEMPIRFHSHLVELGELVSLEVKAHVTGETVVLEGFEGALLCMNPERTQLYVMGGDQAVDLDGFGIPDDTAHESEVLGRVKYIVYHTDKHHLGDQGGIANYRHRFSEEGGECPFLLYDSLNDSLSFSGGTYLIPDEGIRD